MKALSLGEFAQMVVSGQSLVGAQLQDCVQTPSEVGLAFYHEREIVWLWLDLHPQRPVMIRAYGKAPQRKKLTRPLLLFIRSHFFGRRLQSLTADLSRGRVLTFSFHRHLSEISEISEKEFEQGEGVCEIEVRLFPHGQNVIARLGKKQIAERKPKDLPISTTVPPTEPALADRTWEEIEAEWWQEQKAAVNTKASAGRQPAQSAGQLLNQSAKNTAEAAVQDLTVIERDFKKAIDKKEKAVLRMQDDLAAKRVASQRFRSLGDELKIRGQELIYNPALIEDERIRALLEPEKTLSWNIEQAYTKAKENARKIEGTEARLADVRREIDEMKQKGSAGFVRKREKEKREGASNLLARAEAKGRRIKVAGDLEVYIGKSAADNLALLRRAQSFDYWLHLRDQPGSHAILRRTRTRVVTDQEFLEAGRWVVEQSLGRRAGELKGERHDLLIVECRFVRPIKGDRLGRVNYTNDRVLSVRF